MVNDVCCSTHLRQHPCAEKLHQREASLFKILRLATLKKKYTANIIVALTDNMFIVKHALLKGVSELQAREGGRYNPSN